MEEEGLHLRGEEIIKDVEDLVEADGRLEAKLDPRLSSHSFLAQEKSRIYTSNDFRSRAGLSIRQRLATFLCILALAFITKHMLIDPFTTDKERWQRKKELVDKAVQQSSEAEEARMAGTNGSSTVSLFELERAAEEFVKLEEGDDV